MDDPNQVDRSDIMLECIEKCCDFGCQVNYFVTVSNVTNLLAVESAKFNLYDVPFKLTIYKDFRSSNLGIFMCTIATTVESSCKITLTVYILSSKRDLTPITKTQSFQMCDVGLLIENILPWEELIKPENCFVNNNTVTFKVKIELDKPHKCDTLNGVKLAKCETKNTKLECAICLEDFNDQSFSSTPCGHLFCSTCIARAVENRKMCPTCNSKLKSDDLRRIYLPV